MRALRLSRAQVVQLRAAAKLHGWEAGLRGGAGTKQG